MKVKHVLGMFAVFATLTSGATATVANETWRMNPDHLNKFRYDCRVKEQQLAFLASQLPTPWEVFKGDVFGNGILSQVLHLHAGTYKRHRAVRNRSQQAVIKWIMHDIVTNCDWHTIRSPQCMQITDESDYGTSVAKRCYDGRNPQPIINKWEKVD